MSKEKQIEGMARTLNYCCNEYDVNGRRIRNKCNSYDCEYWSEDNFCCCSYGRKEAEALYNAGYRKQSEGEWERQQFKSRIKFLEYNDFTCTKCGENFEVGQGKEFMHFCPNCGARMKGGAK